MSAVEQIKEFLKDVKDKGVVVACDSKLFQTLTRYYATDFKFYVYEQQMCLMGKTTTIINLSNAIVLSNENTLKITDSQGNMITIDK